MYEYFLHSLYILFKIRVIIMIELLHVIYWQKKIFHYQTFLPLLNYLSRSHEKIDCYLSCNPHVSTRGGNWLHRDGNATRCSSAFCCLLRRKGATSSRLRATSFSHELNASRNFSGSSVCRSVKASAREFRSGVILVYGAQRYPTTETTHLFSSVEVLRIHREVLGISL